MIDTEAHFTELYRATYPELLRFVRRRAHPLLVDDIVGETYLAAWRRRDGLPDDARPWLFGTARHAMANAHRGVNRQIAVAVRIAETDPRQDAPSDPSDRLDLQAAWRSLAVRDQEVLALHVWEDLDDRQASAVLGCSRAAYSMRLSRAKRNLANLISRSNANRAPALIPAAHH
ncbi:MAG: sigma-70 family RNA polymerase sigma factor [Pseudolysinimonas sp.]